MVFNTCLTELLKAKSSGDILTGHFQKARMANQQSRINLDSEDGS